MEMEKGRGEREEGRRGEGKEGENETEEIGEREVERKHWVLLQISHLSNLRIRRTLNFGPEGLLCTGGANRP